MKNTLLGGLSSLLLPLGAYSAGAAAGASYQRTYLSSSVSASAFSLPTTSAALPRDLVDLTGDELDIQKAYPVRELVVVDAAVADKAMLHSALKPGVAIVEIESARAGLPQLINALAEYKNLAAVHIVSHAEAGAILLGNSRITPDNIQQEVQAFAALHGAVREGGDLLFYGCDLAANKAGEELLDIISNKTGLDVAASNNLTGNSERDGDWDLEVKRGDIEAELAFSEKALADFSGVLVASNGIKDFTGGTVTWTGSYTPTLNATDFKITAKGGANVAIYDYLGDIYAFSPNMAGASGNFFYVQADGTNTTAFELTSLHGFESPAGSGRISEFTNVRVVGYLQTGGTITSTVINGTAGQDTFLFDTELASFAGQKIKGFKILFDCSTACNVPNDEPAFFSFKSFTITGAVATPIVTDARISIAGASGTGGAYKIGDTVTATWNNTASGDNNGGVTGVTVDFSQFGGGAAVVATNSSGTWTATYTITAGSIDLTARNVSVTATNTGGSDTTADSTNATVDNTAPTVTDGRISISGATGTSGAYKIGDTVTASWNNTAGGDNNTDTISPVTVNFSQFGGGAAVAATNSSGTWTSTYTIVAGAIDATGRNISFSATDNAGNVTTAADTTGATVDNIAPTLSSITRNGTPASTDSSMAFVASFSESVSNISTDDFTLATTSGTATGNIASVSAASGSSVNINIDGISGNGVFKLNLNGSTNIADDAGNAGIAAYSSGSTHTVAIPTAPSAPTIGTAIAGDGQVSVTFAAPGNNGGSAITTYTATASPGGAFGTCAGPAACTATVTGLSNGTAYTFTVTATNAIGTSTASGASNSVTPKGNQTITFPNPGAQNFGTAPDLSSTVSATSSLTVTFSSSTTGICTITSGGALTFVTAGSCTIDADQAGNTAWNAAPTVTQTFTVNAIVPDAPTVGTATAGDTEATVTFTPPANTGGAAIIASGYTVTASPGGATATGSGSPITVTGLANGVAYSFTVTATNSAGEGNPSAPSNSVTPAAPQSITFGNPGTQNFGTTPTLTATSDAGGGYPVSFTSSTTGVCTITAGGALTFVTIGSCTVNADQAGDSSFLAAPQVSQTFTIAAVVPGAPTATTATSGDTQASVAFTTPTFIGGAAITSYTVTTNPADVAPISGASSPIVVVGLTNGVPYTFTVTATNLAGTGDASAASNSITPAASQTITFINPGAQNFATTPTLSATADSGLTPVFTSSTPGVCIITSGGALTFVTIGNCTINADQAGNGSYLAAPQVTRTFAVNAIAPGVPTSAIATAGDASASVAFAAPTFTGGTGITGYTVTSNPGGVTASGAGSPIAVTGLSNGVAYTFTVTATNPAGTGSPSPASNSVTPNGAPVISGIPITSVAQDMAYSFIPTANDTLGDTLTFSIANKPAWAAFDTTTGALTGTPTNADVGTTTSIIISVSDGALGANLAAFNLTVTNVNEVPVISGTPATSVAQDVAYNFTPIASDVDASDVLTFSINNKPTWAAFDTATGALTGTPTNADVGTTSNIAISVSDGTLSASLVAFNLTVTNVNEVPVISGTPATSVAQDVAYSFTPTASDVDAGDVLTYSITNKPTWASFDTATGALTGTPANADVGTTSNIAISVSDGTLSANLAAFNLTVTNVNEVPVISGTPATSVAQDVAYSFTPTASDVDVGDVLTYSITNKPTWAAFDTATGALTGTPANVDVGVTTGIAISVSDGTLSANLAAFNLEVTNTNEAPTISGVPTVSVAQDVAYSFIPTGSDGDVGDVLVYSIINKPTWASFDTTTGALTGTPTNTDVGSTSGIVISVSDGTLSASLAAFDLVVTNTNEAPTITGTPTISLDQDVAYSFIPTGADVDVGDVLTYSITNKPTWAAFDTATGALSGTPTHDHVGTTIGIVISVSDGTLSADLPAFNLEVIETIDPLQPIVTAPADLVINATGLYTPVSLRQLLGLNATATQTQIDQLLAGMASDGISGNTCCVTSPEGLNDRNMLLLRPGRHQLTWKATNAADISGTAVQTIDIRPLVSLSKSQIAIRGSTVEFRVLFNGKAPEYPVSVPYVIDAATTAGSNEHNLVNGVASFTEAGQVEVVVPVQLANVSGLSDSQLVVRLDGDINAGVANTHTIRIREGNIPPIALLQLSQGGVNTTQITPTGGPVTVTARVFDLNPGDTQAFDWSASDTALGDTDGNPVNNTLVFDPTSLTGRHQAQVTVTDSGGATANAQLHFRVVASLPVLQPDTDTDGDGVDDQDEGLGDTNNNGIPDYLDNMPSSNILPQVGNTTNSYLIECDPGVRCGLGKFALTGNSGGVQILDEELGATGELILDPAFEPVGGIFDFVINDLPTPGQSVRIVIPQQAAIPANATYRKYQNGRWVSFIENTNNAIFSAPGNPGYCPPPGTPDWTPGLTAGNLCVQLTIEDGGPNDDDGLVNSALADPGAVSVAEVVVEPPPPPPPAKPPVEIKSKGGGGGAIDGIWLFLLGVLMVFKYVKPRYLALVVLVAGAGNVQAGSGEGFYIRADISNVVSSQEEDEFTAALDAADHEYVLNRYEENRSGYHLALGYEWASFTFTEIGYLDLGEVEVDLTVPANADLNRLAQDFAAGYPLSAEGFTLVQGVTLTPNSTIKVAAEIGVFVWDSEIDVDKQVFSVDDESGSDPLVGIKVEFPLGDHVGMGAGLRRIYFNDQEADLFSLTGSYHF